MLHKVERNTTAKIAIMCSDVIQRDILLQMNDDGTPMVFGLISIHGTLYTTRQLDGTI